MRRTLAAICLMLLAVSTARGAELGLIAVGPWSAPNEVGLRGRLAVYHGRLLVDGETRESFLFVELERMLGWYGVLKVYFDPERLHCELRDPEGAVVGAEPLPVPSHRDRLPKGHWVTLSEAALIRLRASPCCVAGLGPFGLRIPLGEKAWLLDASRPGEYLLSGTLSLTPPAGRNRTNAADGVLKLPGVKLDPSKQ